VLLAGRHKVQAKQFQLRRLLFFNFAPKSKENREEKKITNHWLRLLSVTISTGYTAVISLENNVFWSQNMLLGTNVFVSLVFISKNSTTISFFLFFLRSCIACFVLR
jgi:hypothetical protein